MRGIYSINNTKQIIPDVATENGIEGKLQPAKDNVFAIYEKKTVKISGLSLRMLQRLSSKALLKELGPIFI